MKKVLSILALFGVSYAYGAPNIPNSCPAISSLYINSSGNFAAPDPFGSGKDWVDVNKAEYTLPATLFKSVSGRQIDGKEDGVILGVSCAYIAQPEGQINNGFEVQAPDYHQKYKVDLSSKHWHQVKNDGFTFYVCESYGKDVGNDCPFTIVK